MQFQRWRKRRGAKTGNRSLMPGPGNGKQFHLATIHDGYHPCDCYMNGTCGTCSRFHIKNRVEPSTVGEKVHFARTVFNPKKQNRRFWIPYYGSIQYFVWWTSFPQQPPATTDPVVGCTFFRGLGLTCATNCDSRENPVGMLGKQWFSPTPNNERNNLVCFNVSQLMEIQQGTTFKSKLWMNKLNISLSLIKALVLSVWFESSATSVF